MPLVDAGHGNGPPLRRDELPQVLSDDCPVRALASAEMASALEPDDLHISELVGKGGFEPPASASRTLRANQAALLPVSALIVANRALLGPGGSCRVVVFLRAAYRRAQFLSKNERKSRQATGGRSKVDQAAR